MLTFLITSLIVIWGYSTANTTDWVVVTTVRKHATRDEFWVVSLMCNHPCSSATGIVKIVLIWDRDVQPGIVQSFLHHIKVRGLGWPLDLVDTSCCSNHATVWRVVWAGALSCWNTHDWFLSPNIFFAESRRFSGNVLIQMSTFTFSSKMTRLPTTW